jgi:hypothetical protein
MTELLWMLSLAIAYAAGVRVERREWTLSVRYGQMRALDDGRMYPTGAWTSRLTGTASEYVQ